MRTLLLLLILCAVAVGDTVYLKGGRKVQGRVVAEDPEVVVNPYNSAVKGMVLGVQRFPKDRVKKIVRTHPRPHRDFHRRLKEADDADSCLELAEWCKRHKLKQERWVALEKGLRLDPDHGGIRKALGSRLPKRDGRADLATARRYLEAEEASERARVLAEVKKERGFPYSTDHLQRALRSKAMGTGLVEDRPLAMRADKIDKPVYFTILVPASYDPLRPTPLVVGLHGGGRGGKDGKEVVGSGKAAMPFYRSECDQRGWICVCPNAVVGGWGSPQNHAVIDAVLAEIRALYNIDDHRIYLTGHSMGGGGTWSQGVRLIDTWAAIAPTASFGVRGLGKLEKTRTGFYVYHSDNDPRTRIEGVRPHMENLPGTKADFVYTELPERGHSLPFEVIRDIFEFFEVRRLTVAPRYRPTVRPRSSFRRKVSREEKKYLPPLDRDAEEGEAKLKRLLQDLRTGGGVAQQAVPALVRHGDPKVSSRVAKIMLHKSSAPDVRMYAARILGARKAKGSVGSLGRLLRIETDKQALLAALEALDALDDPGAVAPIAKFLKIRLGYFRDRCMGSRIHHSDWAAIAPTLARACDVLRRYGAKETAPAVADTVVEGIFLSGIEVAYDPAVQNPLHAARVLMKQACAALEAFGDPSVAPLLRRALKQEGPWLKDATISNAVQEALRALAP